MNTFVGMPGFPEASSTAVADAQLRHNLRKATHTIRAKRAAVVAEQPDWSAMRSAIREIFASKMASWGRPAPADLRDDPRALAEAARLHLRERFLSARVGISGANFAVADTGTLVVLESEGNGRMCLTLPETLI